MGVERAGAASVLVPAHQRKKQINPSLDTDYGLECTILRRAVENENVHNSAIPKNLCYCSFTSLSLLYSSIKFRTPPQESAQPSFGEERLREDRGSAEKPQRRMRAIFAASLGQEPPTPTAEQHSTLVTNEEKEGSRASRLISHYASVTIIITQSAIKPRDHAKEGIHLLSFRSTARQTGKYSAFSRLPGLSLKRIHYYAFLPPNYAPKQTRSAPSSSATLTSRTELSAMFVFCGRFLSPARIKRHIHVA
jgi:hypothetical protein